MISLFKREDQDAMAIQVIVKKKCGYKSIINFIKINLGGPLTIIRNGASLQVGIVSFGTPNCMVN